MTRPPFAEFSSLAIRTLIDWTTANAVWSERLRAVLSEHLLPAAEKIGLDPEATFEKLGEFTGEVFGTALEDLCARRHADPPANLVDDFLKRRGYRLPPIAKVYLEAMRDSAPGIYEVVAVHPGRGVTVRDLLLEGELIDVIEVSGSRQIAQWDRLAARIVTHGGKNVFTGAVLPLRSEKGKALLGTLRELLRESAGKAGVSLTQEDFRRGVSGMLRDVAPMIGAARAAEILASRHRSLPQLVNRDGDPIEFVEARYALAAKNRNEVAARLDTPPDLRRVGTRPAKWDWLGKIADEFPGAATPDEGLALDSHLDGDPGRTVLASVTLSGRQVTLSVNSRRRLEKAQTFLEPLLAGLLGEPEIEVKSVTEALAEAPQQPAAPRRVVPKRVEQEVTRRFLDTHYRKWLDDRIPALGGKTPREAAREFGGREQLVALRKDLENLEARRARDTGMSYDARWLWQELGVEHLRR